MESIQLDIHLNEIERKILLKLAETGVPTSPYTLFPIIKSSYQGVHKYGNLLKEKGAITIAVVEGEKKSKKNVYSLTFFGFCLLIKNLKESDNRAFFDMQNIKKLIEINKDLNINFHVVFALIERISQYPDDFHPFKYQTIVLEITAFTCDFIAHYPSEVEKGFSYFLFSNLTGNVSINYFLTEGLTRDATYTNKLLPDIIDSFRDYPEIWKDVCSDLSIEFSRDVLLEIKKYSYILSKEEILKLIEQAIENPDFFNNIFDSSTHSMPLPMQF